MRQILPAWYPLDVEESLGGAPEEMESTNVSVSDLDGEADWEVADLTGDLNIGSYASIRGDYQRLRAECLVVS